MILLHINDKTKRQQIVSLCHSLNHQIKQFNESDAGRTIGELVGIKGVKGTKSEYSADGDNAKLPDCIIFSDVSSQPTHLKAIVTVHNMKWSVSGLIAELKKEQIAIMMRGR